MIERFIRNYFGRPKKNSSNEDEKSNPREDYVNKLAQEISLIENLQIPEPTLKEHLIDHRSSHHYGARCLVILSVGNQTRIGDSTTIKMPKPWQRLIGGKRVKLSKEGIAALEKAARNYEDAHSMEKSIETRPI